MNICMFTNTYLPHVGGVARSVAFFTEDLRKLGHRILVIAPTFPGTEDEDEQEILRVPAIQNFNGSDFSMRVPVPFIINEKIDAFAPEIIHSHHPYLLGDAALRAARSRGLPLVFTHHTLYEQYTHYVPLDSDAMKKFVIQLSTEYANLCTQVVAPSRSIAELIKERGVKTAVEDIPTGVDTEFFGQGQGERFRRAHEIPEQVLVIGHLGRLAPEKNLTYLAESVALYLQENEEVYFLVAGSGPSKEEIRQLFSDQGLDSQLVMPGTVTGDELADAYKAMDLFVFASKSETQGMVLAEAMAAGKAVVALDASGSREVVEDGKNGRLLSGDASREEFAQAIREIIESPKDAENWRKEALETARQLSREACARRLLSLYEKVRAKISTGEVEQGKPEELFPWETMMQRLRAEWELLSEKTRAAVGVIRAEEER
jgi:glycosyltransferase involved in cell wall biosynthesis